MVSYAAMSELAHQASFQARGDDGRKYIVHIYTDPDDPASPPTLILRTTGDLEVRRLEKGAYEIVLTGTVLRSDNPSAP